MWIDSLKVGVFRWCFMAFGMPWIASVLSPLAYDEGDASDWFPVPVLAVDEGVLEEEAGGERNVYWMESVERSRVQVINGESLVLSISEGDGFNGESLTLRFLWNPEESLRCFVKSSWTTDVGDTWAGADADVHGVIWIEEFGRGSSEPLRLRYRLDCVRWTPDSGVQAVLKEGGLVVDMNRLRDARSSMGDALSRGRLGSDCVMHETSRRWQGGGMRSQGLVDAKGFRHGIWVTWFENGDLQSLSEWKNGVRDGLWEAFQEGDALPIESGQYLGGFREGAWLERHWEEQERILYYGAYMDGRKEGLWVGMAEDGGIRSQGKFKDNEKEGVWLQFWPNGNRRWEGRYESGHPVGSWVYWDKDGKVMERKERHLYPWQRERER